MSHEPALVRLIMLAGLSLLFVSCSTESNWQEVVIANAPWNAPNSRSKYYERQIRDGFVSGTQNAWLKRNGEFDKHAYQYPPCTKAKDCIFGNEHFKPLLDEWLENQVTIHTTSFQFYMVSIDPPIFIACGPFAESTERMQTGIFDSTLLPSCNRMYWFRTDQLQPALNPIELDDAKIEIPLIDQKNPVARDFLVIEKSNDENYAVFRRGE